MTNVALGKRVLEPTVVDPAAATNGKTTGYTKSFGYASFRWPGSLTVDLDRDYRVRCIRILLWSASGPERATEPSRRYRYALLTRSEPGADGQPWSLLYATSDAGSSGWQVFRAKKPFAVRWIRIEGLHNTANAHFHVVQVEAYPDEPPPLPDPPGADLEVLVDPSQKVTREGRATTRSHQDGPVENQEGGPPTSTILAGAPEPQVALQPRRDRQLSRGTTLDSYRLVERIGQGYSATVWKAEVLTVPPGVALAVGEIVAVKVYRPEILLAGVESIRVQREFAIASQVDHPSLGRVFDVVVSPSRPWHTFLVMEYVEGATLKEHLERSGPFPALATTNVGRQLLEGVDALHSQQALHRDIKAANVIVTDATAPVVKLLDFGIVTVSTDAALTSATTFLGSKHSAPLEQLTGRPLDARVDIYAIGSVMYHCYMGRPPYDGAGPEGAIVQQMLERPARAVARVPEDGRLVDFINRCLAVDAQHRPRTAEVALAALKDLTEA